MLSSSLGLYSLSARCTGTGASVGIRVAIVGYSGNRIVE